MTNKRQSTNAKMFENIYDVICNTAFSYTAEKQLKSWTKRVKNVSLDMTEGKEATIKIGKNFIITLKGEIK